MLSTLSSRVTAVSLCATLLAGNAYAQSFSNTIFFGDSLSDAGAFVGQPDALDGGRFTTNPGPVWTELLAGGLGAGATANNPTNPMTDPTGTNFAQGGAQVNNPIGVGQSASPQNALPIASQVGFYLNTRGPADPDALYSIWGGANDVFFQAGLVGAGLSDVNTAVASMMTSAGTVAALAGVLASSGANYILIPNLPDIGATPAMVLSAVAAVGAGNPNLGAALGAAGFVLAQPANTPAERAALQSAALAAAAAQLGVPAAVLVGTRDQLRALSSGLVQAFNLTLNAALPGTNANVIPLDIFSLFNELLADPTSFGFLNTTGTACITPSSLFCTADDFVHPAAAQIFLFADGVHPTSAGHRAIADYAASVLAAPGQISQLAEAPLALGRAVTDALATQAKISLLDDRTQGWSWFVSTTRTDSELKNNPNASGYEEDGDSVMVGGARRFNAHWAGGIAIAKSNANVEFSGGRGGFDLDATTLAGFIGFRKGRYFGEAIATLGGDLSFTDIDRVIPINQGRRTERGNTGGDHIAIKLNAGANLAGGDAFAVGPLVGVGRQRVSVSGYSENGARATALSFGDQARNSFIVEAGVFAAYRTPAFTLRGTLTREREFEHSGRVVEARLNTLDGSFQLPAVQLEENSWNFGLTASARFGQRATAYAAITVRDGDDFGTRRSASLGIQVDL